MCVERGRGLFPSCSFHSDALWWHRGGAWGGPFSSSLISAYLLIPNLSGRAPQASTAKAIGFWAFTQCMLFEWSYILRKLFAYWRLYASSLSLRRDCYIFFLLLNYNWMRTFTHSFTFACIHTHTCIHELTHTRTYTHSYTHLHTLIYSHSYTHAHTFTLTFICTFTYRH